MKLAGGKLDRILFIVGNDVAHIDSKKGQTTAGTPMDVDTRYIRVFRRICQIHREAVLKLVDVAPVDIVVVPGNHDELTSFLVGEILGATFHNNRHVTIDNNPHLRKYYKYGINLFGFTHGDAEKVSELGLLMAREASELWHEGQSREWHIGHLHIAENWEHRAKLVQGLHSDKGVRIRRLTSMSAHDAWHTKHGYTDRRACDTFVFHRDAGFTGHLSFNIDHFSGKALSI
jgi:DNA repair exonuclease SbcCD nuclease subunit